MANKSKQADNDNQSGLVEITTKESGTIVGNVVPEFDPDAFSPEMPLSTRIAKIRGKVGVILKKEDNDFNNAKYADLGDILDKLNGLLSEYEITVYIDEALPMAESKYDINYQTHFVMRAVIECATITEKAIEPDVKELYFSFGKLKQEQIKKINDIQISGAHLSYAQRYIYCNIFGIALKGEDPDSIVPIDDDEVYNYLMNILPKAAATDIQKTQLINQVRNALSGKLKIKELENYYNTLFGTKAKEPEKVNPIIDWNPIPKQETAMDVVEKSSRTETFLDSPKSNKFNKGEFLDGQLSI